MSLHPAVSIVEAGPADAITNVMGPFLKAAAEVNVVNESIKLEDGSEWKVKDYAERFIWEIIVRCKQRRMSREQDWLAIQRMIVKKHDENQRYVGNSNAYIPLYKRNRRTLVSNLSQGLFPSDEFMDVVDREQGENEEAKAVKMVLQYEFENSGLMQAVRAFLGQYVDFGVSCLKVLYRLNVGNRSPYDEAMYEESEGLEVVPRSMFNVVVYPESADNKRQLQVEAERMEVPVSYVNDMARLKRWENVREALANHGTQDDFDWVNTATLYDVAALPGLMELRDQQGSPVEAVIVVEAWCRMLMPRRMYGPGEDHRSPVPVQVVFVNGVAVRVRRNPFWHQSSPFLYARDNQILGSFYSDGAGADTQAFQYLANDHFNQLNDCMTFGMMPMWLANPNYMAGPMDTQRPGRVFKVRDIDKALKPIEPNINMVQYGKDHAMNVVSMGQDSAGAPPILQGSKGGAGTATQSQIQVATASGPLKDQVEDIESSVMVQLMSMAWSLSRQYRTEPFIRSMGQKTVVDPMTGQPVQVDDVVKFLPQQINIKPRFRFLSSSQAANRQLRQQGLTLFTDLAGKLAPNLQMTGKMLNPEAVLRRAWTDGLGNRNFDQVIVPMPMPGVPPMPGSPSGGQPAMPPVGAVPQGNVPGAVNNEPVVGEGEVTKPIMDAVQKTNAIEGQSNIANPVEG